jgi:hypothetical protein
MANPTSFAGLHKIGVGADGMGAEFHVPCVCGAALHGRRLAQAQTIRCEKCGRTRFILPCGLLAPPGASPTSSLRNKRFSPYRAAIIGGGALLALLAGAGAWLLIDRVQSGGSTGAERPLKPQERFEQHVLSGREAFAQGAYHQAERDLTAALRLEPDLATRPSAKEIRQLRQQQRQAAIVNELLSEPLSEIIMHAVGTSEAEWQETFRRRYWNRSFILDDTLHRDALGAMHYNFRIQAGGATGQLELDDLTLLRAVSLSAPQRVVIGMRLSSIRRDAGGSWIIHPAPDSGVLITDEQLVSALSVPLDAELKLVLQRQEIWLASLP